MTDRTPSRLRQLETSLKPRGVARERTPRRSRPAEVSSSMQCDAGHPIALYREPAVASPPAGTPAEQPVPPPPPSEDAPPPPPVARESSRPAPSEPAPEPVPEPLPEDGWAIHPEAADDEEFTEDVRAILAHAAPARQRSAGLPLPVAAPAPSSPPPVDAASSKGVGMAAGHDIFDRIAGVHAPDRFDQGPVSLAVDFSSLDRALDRASGGAPAEPAPAEPATPPEPAPAPAAEQLAPGQPVTPFRISADVPLLAQAPGISCHAAACAAIVGWRDDIVPDPAAVAAASGYWERYADGRTAAFPDALAAFGLQIASAGKAPPPTALRDLMDARGPLWLAASPPGAHAVVIAGLAGDGTPAGTTVDVVDPWAPGMTAYAAPNPGSRYSLPYPELLSAIAGPDSQIVLAHLREGTPR